MRIPDNLKKCVLFLGIKTPEESIEKLKYIGTVFVVSIPAKTAKGQFLYLVTAKHVAVKTQGKQCFLRANLKDGTSAFFEIKNTPWFYHPNETWPSDVAVYPFLLEANEIRTIDFEAISITNFMSDETRISQAIGEGDEIFTVGLFSRHTGTGKNLPIIRMGNIAMISDEPIQTQKFGNLEAYLIEARSIKGLSGSPVFVLKPNAVRLGEHIIMTSVLTIHFFGLMHGHWDLAPGENVDVDDTIGGTESVNMGIAIVIPAKIILETLNHNELVSYREKNEAKWIAKNSPPSNSK